MDQLYSIKKNYKKAFFFPQPKEMKSFKTLFSAI